MIMSRSKTQKVSIGFAGGVAKIAKFALVLEALYTGVMTVILVLAITLKAITFDFVSDAVLAGIVRYWYPFIGYGLIALAITAIIYLIALVKSRQSAYDYDEE